MTEPSRTHDPACIFCRIVAGAIPCHKVYEDDLVLAFLDIAPLAPGHTLVIPKRHAARLEALDEASAARCALVAARLGAAVVERFDAPGWNLLQNNGAQAGQVVLHVHFHVIPRHAGDALGYRRPAGQLDPAAAARQASALRLPPLSRAEQPG